VQSSRALHLLERLIDYYPSTYLVIEKNDKTWLKNDNTIQIDPMFQIENKFVLTKGIIFRLQITLYSLYLIITKNFDYVVLRGYDTIVLFLFSKIFRIKTYYDYHGRFELELIQRKRYLKAFIVKWIDKFILKYADGIIVVSNGIKSQIEEYSDKCILLPNGVDVERIESADTECPVNIPDDKKVIGFIGNWEQVMRIEDICDSIKYLQNTVAVVVGQGYQHEKIFNKYENEDGIIFTGKIEQELAYSILKRMDICIVPYDKEFYMSKMKNFFSNRKISEYLAAGKPILMADIEGIPDYLDENNNYIKYESRDPFDLAEKVNYLFNNPELYETLSQNNKELAKQLSWENIVKESGLIEDINKN
jgi:glycosyltransferase involved in cell wall biosynthesis